MQITDDGADRLLGAIAEQAIKDYKRAWTKKARYPGDIFADQRMSEIESFFKGRTFKWMFPRLDGTALFKELRRQCMLGNRKNKSYVN